jgi:hypothetical protein
MVQLMFEATQTGAPAILTQSRSIGGVSISNMLHTTNNP